MDQEKTTGYRDQELLLNAFCAYVSKKTHRSEHIIKGLMRQSIFEWANANSTTLKDIKKLSDVVRLEILNTLIDTFLEKIKHIETSNFQRKQLKKDALLIYSHWKATKQEKPVEETRSEKLTSVDTNPDADLETMFDELL